MRNCGSESGGTGERGGGSEGEEVETGARREGEGARPRSARGTERDGGRTGQEKINRPANMCREEDEGKGGGREGEGGRGRTDPP